MGTLKGGTPLTPDTSPGHAEVAWQAFWGVWKSEGSARTKAPLSRGVQRLPAGVRRVGRGKADYGCGAATVRSAGGGGRLTATKRKLGLARLCCGHGIRGACFVSVSARSTLYPAAILWRGRHFAPLERQGARGGAAAARRGGGGGLAAAPGLPSRLLSRRRVGLLCSSPLGWNLRPQALPRPARSALAARGV